MECPSKTINNAKLPGLLGLWEATNHMEPSQALADVRDWLMDAIEAKAPEGFNAWLNQDEPRDEDLRRFVTVNIMCLSCLCFGVDCKGTTPEPWTGCVYRKTAKDRG